MLRLPLLMLYEGSFMNSESWHSYEVVIRLSWCKLLGCGFEYDPHLCLWDLFPWELNPWPYITGVTSAKIRQLNVT